jgi:hypothetical protein
MGVMTPSTDVDSNRHDTSLGTRHDTPAATTLAAVTGKSGKGTARQTIRVEEDLWERFGESATAADSDRSTLLREFMRWHAGEPATKPPRRPATAVRWNGSNFEDVKAIRPDARINANGDLEVERVNQPGEWVVVGRNYLVYRRGEQEK